MFAKDYLKDYPEPESVVAVLMRGLKVEEIPVIMRESRRWCVIDLSEEFHILYDKSSTGDYF